MIQGKLRKYSHYFTVVGLEPKLRNALLAYMKEETLELGLVKKQGRFRQEPKRMWCRRSLRTEERAFNINEYDTFIQFMAKYNITEADFDLKTVRPYDGDDISFDAECWSAFPQQEPLIEHALGDLHQYAITASPGFGKTVCSLLVAKAIGKRFAVVTKGGYEGRWIPAFYDIVGFKPEEVRSCCGAKAIEKLVNEFKKHGPEATKAIFFSIGGLRDYIKNFEAGKYKSRKHPCHDVPPEKLFKFLGIGLKIVDEAHQEIHAHYLVDLYTNIKHSLYLTGTLIPQTDFMAKRYQIFLPDAIRKSDEKLNIYAKAVEVFYRLHDPEHARFVGPQGSYSHVTYEQWLMKDEKRLNNWLAAMYDYVVASWASNRIEETKALLFAATIELCDRMREYFARRFPDLRVAQYKAGDPYDFLVDNDILFATLGKAGTAVDIPDLEQVFMTTAIDSGNANIQAFGRLRDLKQYPDLTCVFHWFTCLDSEKQVEYGKNKRKLLEKRVKGIRTEYMSRKI